MGILIHVLGLNQFLEQHSCCDISQACVLACALVSCNLVSYQASQCPTTLLANSLSDANGSNTSRLGHNYVTIPSIVGVLVKNVLWNLSGFATTCGS